jgi:hypothetical protein
MTEIENPKQNKQSLTRRKRLRCALNRFEICNFEFEIYLKFGAWDL